MDHIPAPLHETPGDLQSMAFPGKPLGTHEHKGILFGQRFNLLKTFKVGGVFPVMLISPFAKSAQQISKPLVGKVLRPALFLDLFPVEVGKLAAPGKPPDICDSLYREALQCGKELFEGSGARTQGIDSSLRKGRDRQFSSSFFSDNCFILFKSVSILFRHQKSCALSLVHGRQHR